MLALIFCACSNECSLLVPSQGEISRDKNGISVVVVNNGKIQNPVSRNIECGHRTLRFSDCYSLNAFIATMEKLSDDERNDIMDTYGVNTLHKLELSADNELESIGKEASCEAEFRMLYKQFVEKYKGSLITNNLDSTDLDLYVPDGDNVMTFIANEELEYVLGDEVIKCPIHSEQATPTRKMFVNNYSSSNSTSTDYNSDVYSPIDGKKIYFNAYMVGERMWVKMYARKKMWYGWKNNPNRYFFFDPYLSLNFQYLSQGANGQEVVVSPLPRYIFNQNVKNGFDIILGRINGGASITGQIKTRCDITSEHDSNGNQLTEIKNGMTVPKCLDSKARIVNINLTPQY